MTRSAQTASQRQPAAQAGALEKGVRSWTAGEAVVQDGTGNEVSRTAAYLFGRGWIAIPVSALLGGKALSFQAGEAPPIPIEQGVWSPSDPVAFWQVEAGGVTTSPELASWKQALPLEWHALRSTGPPLQPEVGVPTPKGSFLAFVRPYEIRAPGVFIQDGALVGWTFGEPIERGYLWKGPGGATLTPTIRVAQFFSAISANCREAYFRDALANEPGKAPAERYEMLARGFRLMPLLDPEDLPPPLRQPTIVNMMHSLASDLIQNGKAEVVFRILDDQTLREASDPVLVKDAVTATAKYEDYNRAIRRLEKLEKEVFAGSGQTHPEILQFRSQLYKDWLRRILEKGDYYSGMTAFEEASRAFPDDMEIQLLGVECAIAEKNWDRARELLGERDYPPALKEWTDRLRTRISAKQEEAEAIVIKFNPGEQLIPIEAVLNGFHTQKFIIDTGANIVSIPSSAAATLNIKVDDSTPVKAITTASGVAMVPEVTLQSIRLADYSVYNLKALVLDLPAYPDHGVLGLNFLNNFGVEIDKQKGILRLRRRQS